MWVGNSPVSKVTLSSVLKKIILYLNCWNVLSEKMCQMSVINFVLLQYYEIAFESRSCF